MAVTVPAAALHQETEPVDAVALQALDHTDDPLSADQALALLRALADPIRLRVVETLARGERCVCELTSELTLAQSKLSFHLKVLKQAGLIASRQQGRWMYYRLEPKAVVALSGWLAGRAVGCGRPATACG
jgi:ArsR family transcriptional regulator